MQYKLRSVSLIVGSCAIAGTLYEHILDNDITLMGPLIGSLLGFLLAVFEVLIPWKKRYPWPFGIVVILKASLYVLLVSLVIVVSSYLYHRFLKLPDSEFLESMVQGRMIGGIASTFLLYLIIIFFWNLNRLLGPGVLFRYLIGRYYQPRRERRIFMFLDLKDSTALAERMDYEQYFAFLNDFFHDLTEPILATQTQIYQYVGDEAVFTWKLKEGLRKANCVQLYFEIENVICRRRDYYIDRYGVVPVFKAGVHCGEAIVAEIGDLKRDLVYNGDVLNTTSRIQSLCNHFDAKLLVSSALIDQLSLPERMEKKDLGDVSLRGKRKPLSIYRLDLKSDPRDNNSRQINRARIAC